ncbi:MAG: AAA family ATPase, partial [Clostridia bacterium]
LKNVVLMPQAGLNLLTLPNEAGKSTLAAFLKFIFYGFGGNRKQSISENEKQLYMPWDGSAAEGGINIATSKGKFCIERTFGNKNELVEITDLMTGKNIYSGGIPGEIYFGLSEETFAKTLFMKQLVPPQNGDFSLAEQLQNLLFTADERVNNERATKRLKEAKSVLQNNQKHGLISTETENLDDLTTRLSAATEINSLLEKVNESLNDKKLRILNARKRLAELEEERQNTLKYEAKMRLVSLFELDKIRTEKKHIYNNAIGEFAGESLPDMAIMDTLINENANFMLCQKHIDELNSAIDSENSELKKVREMSPFFLKSIETVKSEIATKKLLVPLFFVVSALFFAGATIFAVLGSLEFGMYSLLAMAIISLAIAVVFAFKKSQIAKNNGFSSSSELAKGINEFPVLKSKADSLASRIASLEKKYAAEANTSLELKNSLENKINHYMHIEKQNEYGMVLKKMLTLSSEIGKLKAEFLSANEEYERLLKSIGDVDELKLFSQNAKEPLRERAKTERETEFTRSQMSSLQTQEMELEKQKSSYEAKLESPVVLESTRKTSQEKLDDYKRKYEALALALKILEEAGDKMKSTVSPKLAELASVYFDMTSGGKYPSISLTTDLAMSYDDENVGRNIDFLSSGTKDVAYLCLRFAIVELIYDDKRPFILLDDAFSRLDDNRIRLMLKTVNELSKIQQIFILTCHGRDGDILDQIGADYTRLRF